MEQMRNTYKMLAGNVKTREPSVRWEESLN